MLGAASGAVAGLVAITPGAGFVGPMSAILIGIVVGVHGVGGTWGALATGLFASKAINAAGNDGLFFGNPGQLWTQFVAVAGTWIFAAVGTLIILGILKAVMGLRVSEEEEQMGLDLSQHDERGYAL